MIFVTVGTHEQQFNRLIEEIDRLKGNGTIKDEVIMQTGYCTYKPKYCKWSELLPYDQMLENVEKADIVITHGGPSSFIMPLQIGKIPIVVPRQKRYDEHVNNHQIQIVENFNMQGFIIGIKDVEELENAINKIPNFKPNKYKTNTQSRHMAKTVCLLFVEWRSL